MNEPRADLPRTVLAVLFLGLLIASSLWILSPFLIAVVWATLIAVATWPLMLSLERLLWGKRKLAVAVLTIALLSVVMVPFLAGVVAIVKNVDAIAGFAQKLSTRQLPPAPAWLEKIPVMGAKAADTWNHGAEIGLPALLKEASPYLSGGAYWFTERIGAVSALVATFLLTVIITAVMYATGESAVAGVKAFFRRLAGEKGEASVDLAGGAIRAVAMGVIVTALAQSLLAGLGLLIAGVPFVGLLTAIMFVLAIAQIGPLPVLLLVVIWSYSTQGSGWGTFLLVWSIVAGTVDNFLKPVLIKKGADLPLLLIFAGVIGGLISFGLIGIFVGPVVLAVTYTLVQAWVRGEGSAAAP
ncbi:MAG: AI-2E family transporter YdiK [Acidithiobacillales bacterium]